METQQDFLSCQKLNFGLQKAGNRFVRNIIFVIWWGEVHKHEEIRRELEKLTGQQLVVERYVLLVCYQN